MNFLSNLWDTAKSAFSGISQYIGNQTASALNSFSQPLGKTQGTNASIAPQPASYNQTTTAPNASYAPNVSTPLGIGQASPSGQITYLTPTGTNLLQSVNYNTQQAAYTPTVRPSTYTPAPDQYGRVSSSSQGNPYLDASGNYIVPTTGFSGISGAGGGGYSSMPTQGANGNMGTGQSNFTGNLGATSMGGSTFAGTTSDEQKRKQDELNKTKSATPGTQPAPVNLGNVPAQMTAPLPTSGTSNTFDLSKLTSSKENVAKYLSNPNAMSQADLQTTFEQLTSDFNRIKAGLVQSEPTPANPVVNTPEQDALIKGSSDPYGVKSAMDAFTAQNTTLGELQTQRIDNMKSIKALNEAYKPIIDDIKNNPNLPKGLAQRRLALLQDQQKKVLQGFLDTADILTQQISDQNQIVNRQFGIVQNAQSQEEKAKDNARANLQLFVSTGAIGGFGADDISRYANTTGISSAVIKKMVDTAKNPAMDIKTDTFGYNGTGLRVISTNKQTGEVTVKTIAQPQNAPAADQNTLIQQQLLEARNVGPEADGVYTDPNLYASLRGQSKMSATDFDNRFGYLVNPISRAKLGIGSGSTSQTQSKDQLSADQLSIINNAKSTWDTAKQTYRNTPELRQQIIDVAKQKYQFDISPYF